MCFVAKNKNPQSNIATILSRRIGRCRAAFPRFYFDGARCRRFTYGGCGGNGNNFRTEGECTRVCQGGGARCCKIFVFCTEKDSKINVTKYIDRAGKSLDLELEGELDEEEEKEEEVEDICNLEIQGGPCFALEEAWGYNSTIGR